MHKAQRGHKLSVVRKVVTPLNFVTLPSFSVTLPSCDPLSDAPQKILSGDRGVQGAESSALF